MVLVNLATVKDPPVDAVSNATSSLGADTENIYDEEISDE